MAVDVALECELHVVLGHLLVNVVGQLALSSAPVRGHSEVLFLLLVILDVNARGLPLLNLVLSHQDLQILLPSALVEQHVGRGTIRVAQGAEVRVCGAALLLVAERSLLQLFELPDRLHGCRCIPSMGRLRS